MELPEFEHAVVYGVEVPHTDGRAGMAAVTLKSGAQPDWGIVTRHLREKLPAYSIPLFIRLREQEEVTGTFKYRKVELKDEAYHLAKVSEPVMVLKPQSAGYEALTSETEQAINDGRISF